MKNRKIFREPKEETGKWRKEVRLANGFPQESRDLRKDAFQCAAQEFVRTAAFLKN